MERRDVVGGGLVAGLGALLAPEPSAAAAQDDDGRAARAVEDLRRMLERQFSDEKIAEVRRQQRVHLRAHQKYPDFIEVGVGIWEDVYDWHVKHQQPIVARVLADGRYGITFMFTTLVLRTDQAETYVGFPYDGDAPRR